MRVTQDNYISGWTNKDKWGLNMAIKTGGLYSMGYKFKIGYTVAVTADMASSLPMCEVVGSSLHLLN